jgi:DNA-binding IclR family transcriptional regulator
MASPGSADGRQAIMATLTSQPGDSRRSSPHSGVQVIARAVAILRALGRHPEGLSIREIGRLIGVPRSTVQRIVDALDQESFVISANPASGVKLGPALIGLGAMADKFDLAVFAQPIITELSKALGETVALALFDRDKAVVVKQVAGRRRVRAVSVVGDILPLHCTASGKAILALLPDEHLDQLRQRLSLRRYTENTITNWRQLDAEIRQIQKKGLAFDNAEYVVGLRDAAVAFRGPGDEIAAISVPVPTERFTAAEDAIAQQLLQRLPRL